MNRLYSVWMTGICLCMSSVVTNAQVSTPVATDIKPLKVAVTFYKTTNLIFPYAIKSVDRGSSAILVQKAKGVDNILQVKAGKKNFEQTNLSLVTADGAFYSFVLEYGTEPSQLNLRFEKSDEVPLAELNDQTSIREMEQEAEIIAAPPSFLNTHSNQQRMRLSLNGIFLSDRRMWFRLQLDNHSQIDFKPDIIRFFLRDKKKTKRTAIQETELFPLYSRMDEIIAGLETGYLSIAFDPFTIPRNKRLFIQVGKQGSGRIINLIVKSRTVLKARKM